MPEHTVLEDFPQPPSPASSDEGETKFDFSGWSLDGGRIDVTKFLRFEPEDDDLPDLDLGLKLDLALPAPDGAKQPDFGEVDPEGFPSGHQEPVSPPDFGEVDPEGFDSVASPVDWVELLYIFPPDTLDLWPG